MRIESKDELDAAAKRANALSDAVEGTPAAEELADLVTAIRDWEARRVSEDHGPDENPEPGTNRSPDDLPFSGLPGNLGKLRA